MRNIQRNKLPALPEGAGGAPALLYPVDAQRSGAKHSGAKHSDAAKMHGIMQEVLTHSVLTHSIRSERFRIIPAKPLYHFSSYSQSWYRILMMENGQYLRIQLTPLNPTVQNEWFEMLGEKLDLIQWSGGIRDRAKDRYTCALPAEVVRHMHYHLGSPHAERLLTSDIWAEIEPLWPTEYEHSADVSNWLARCGYNGGIPLSKIQKNPPTWEEKWAAEEKVRNEAREARITAAVGSQEPLNETERALGLSLEQHDWSYSYSDDGSVWRRGQDHRDELERGLKSLPVERARIVWKAFVQPYNEQYWRCPV